MQLILDIGANSHMSLDEDDLDGLRLLNDPINISITNECLAEETSTGPVPTIITNGEFVIIRFFYLFQIQIDDFSMMERKLASIIKLKRADNGKEYIISQFSWECRKNGIIYRSAHSIMKWQND
ncbi:hypothetical protein ABG067_007476 [Albugo candida]